MATYEIVAELGRGGMGVVHRARQKELNREVALKLLLPGVDTEADGAPRFFREIKALMGLSHPNIVRVLDCGQLDGSPYYAMELVSGRTIEDLIKAGKVPVARALTIARQLAEALAHCHKHRLIHRDVKPGNVMVGENDHVTLMDFGIVRIEGRTVLTAAGQALGTPHYLPPEAVKVGQVSPAGDVYAAGIVLAEMLAGIPPFRANTLEQLLPEIANQGPMNLRQLCPDLAVPVVDLVAAMTALDPAARPTAADAAAQMGMLTGQTPKRITRKTGRITKPVAAVAVAAPNQTVRLAATALVLLALGAGGYVALQPRDPAPPVVAPSASPSGSAGAPEAPPSIVAVVPAGAPAIRVEYHPPRRMAITAAAGDRYRVTQDGAVTAEGALGANRAAMVTGVQPGERYEIEISGAGAASVTTSTAIPLPLREITHTVKGETYWRIQWNCAEPVTMGFRVTRMGDGTVLWSGRAENATYFGHTVRNLQRDTQYQLARWVVGQQRYLWDPMDHGRTRTKGHVRAILTAMKNARSLDSLTSLANMERDDVIWPDVDTLPEARRMLDALDNLDDVLSVRPLVGAIGRTFEPAVVPDLEKALKRATKPEIRAVITEALGDVRHPDAYTALRRNMDLLAAVPPWIVMNALVKSDWAAFARDLRAMAADPKTLGAFERGHAPAAMIFGRAPELAEPLVDLALAHRPLIEYTGIVLAQNPLPAIRRATARFVHAAGTIGQHDQVYGALAALGACGWASDEELVTDFTAAARPLRARVSATHALAGFAGPSAETTLLALLSDGQPAVRRAAAHALGRRKAKGAVDALIARLKTDDAMHGRAARALGMIGDARAVPALVAAADRDAPCYPPGEPPRAGRDLDQAEALWALTELRHPGVLALVKRGLKSEVDYVRARAVEALGLLGDKAALPLLDAATKRPGETAEVKRLAHVAAGWLKDGPPSGRRMLVDATERTQSSGVKIWPCDAVKIRASGCWGRTVDAALNLANGVKAGSEDKLWLGARVGYSWISGRDVIEWSDHYVREDAVAVAEVGQELQGFGFMTVWVHVDNAR